MREEKPRRRPRQKVVVGEIIEFLEYLAPPALSELPAPYGLQVGSATATVNTVLVAPLPTYSAISCAAAYKAALLITASPLLTQSLSAVHWDDPVGSKIAHLVNRQVSLYSLSNAYAIAPGGLDDSLAECLGLVAKGSLLPTTAEAQYKFVVAVPPTHLERVRNSAIEAGASRTGHYGGIRHRQIEGESNRVDEVRLELRVSARALQGVLAAVLESHSANEVAYDIYPLHNPGTMYGRGRVGELPLEVSLETVLAQVTDALELGTTSTPRCFARTKLPISSLAVVSGTEVGAKLLHAAIRQEVGAVITGGVSVTDQILVDGASTVLIDVGFAPSVAPGLRRLVNQLEETFSGDSIQIIYTE